MCFIISKSNNFQLQIYIHVNSGNISSFLRYLSDVTNGIIIVKGDLEGDLWYAFEKKLLEKNLINSHIYFWALGKCLCSHHLHVFDWRNILNYCFITNDGQIFVFIQKI